MKYKKKAKKHCLVNEIGQSSDRVPGRELGDSLKQIYHTPSAEGENDIAHIKDRREKAFDRRPVRQSSFRLFMFTHDGGQVLDLLETGVQVICNVLFKAYISGTHTHQLQL